MWLCLNDAFLSIVKKDCPDGSLLVRARRPGDIEKVFGRRVKVTRLLDSDYLFRAVIRRDDVTRAIQDEVLRIDYGNFKDSVSDNELHDAYMKVWTAMSLLQNPKPYSESWKWTVAKANGEVPTSVDVSTTPGAATKKLTMEDVFNLPDRPVPAPTKRKKKGGKKWKTAAIPQP